MPRGLSAWILVAALAAPLASACTRAHAKTTPEMPLDVPPPPPRVIDSTEPEPQQQPVSLPEEPAHHSPPRTTKQAKPPDAPKPEAPRPEPPKPETPPAEAPKPPEEAPKPPPTTTLQTTPPQAEVEMEKSVRTLLARAQTDLNRVDYQGLNNDARGQYDQAKRFMSQADEALRGKNLVFAHVVADKAAALAAQLAGR